LIIFNTLYNASNGASSGSSLARIFVFVKLRLDVTVYSGTLVNTMEDGVGYIGRLIDLKGKKE